MLSSAHSDEGVAGRRECVAEHPPKLVRAETRSERAGSHETEIAGRHLVEERRIESERLRYASGELGTREDLRPRGVERPARSAFDELHDRMREVGRRRRRDELIRRDDEARARAQAIDELRHEARARG